MTSSSADYASVRAKVALAGTLAVFAGCVFTSAAAAQGNASEGSTAGQVAPKAALSEAEAALSPAPGADPIESREATIALRDLALAVPDLEGANRAAAKDLLARPTDDPDPNGNSYKVAEETPFCSAHFCVHYVASTADAPDLLDAVPANGIPDYVEEVSAAAETSYAVENGTLGWPAPISDGDLGGGQGLTDIYLVDVGNEGIFGYASPDSFPEQRCKKKCYAYLVLDQDFAPDEFPGYLDPTIPLEVTMAHEYNHVLQFGIDAIQDRWLFESTATWAEEKVFPNDNDYVNYLTAFAKTPSTPITDFNGGGGLKIYGLATFQHWLDSGEGNFGPSVILGNWLNSQKSKPADYAVGSTDKSIRERGGSGFPGEFSEFAAATAEWQTAGPFPDAVFYPDVRRKGKLAPGKRSGNFSLRHTSYRLFDVGTTTKASLKLKVKAERKTQTGIALVGRDDHTASVARQVKLLKNGGRGSVKLANASTFERITAVVVNADGRVNGYGENDWNYTRDNRRFNASLGG